MRRTQEQIEARIEVITYFLSVATSTNGAEVWRALFAEALRTELQEREIVALKAEGPERLTA